jgi:O-antigen/teichoic acid export membrane protein
VSECASEPVGAADASGAPSTGKGSYGAVAAKGSFINTVQWLVNKFATAISMLVIAHFLAPQDYGVANLALAIAQFMMVFFPLTMGDVLIAHPRELESLVPTARRLALAIGAATGALILASIPVFLRIYPDDKYPSAWLGGLLAVLAFRPVIDAFLMVPLARLRIGLQYRRIAVIDGLVQLGATVASLGMAIFGLRAASLIAPQVAGTAARAVCYRRAAPTGVPGGFERGVARMLMRAYLPAASAQYLHNIIVMLELLVLGYVTVGEAARVQTGLFAFAFQVAAQANTVVAYQLGVVLQPIFGHLRDDPQRQVAGFLRVQRVLGLVCVPISIAQAVLAEPLFRVAFPKEYEPAIPVFQVISLAQAFYFATGPSMSCLRSQRRFLTFLVWQGVQFVVSVPLYWFGAARGGALGVALASAGVWAASAPVVVWLCTRVAPGWHLGSVLMVFIKPWLISAPAFALAWLGVRWLAGFGKLGDLGSLVVLGPVAALVSIGASRWFDAEMRSLSDRASGAVRNRFQRLAA